MKTLLGFVLAILLSGNVFATTLCEKIFSDNITSNVVSISQFRARASEVKRQSNDRKAQFLGLTPEQMKSNEDIMQIQEFLFDSTTNGTQISFLAAYGQLKGRGIGKWPLTFHIMFDPNFYGRLVIGLGFKNGTELFRFYRRTPDLLYPIVLKPGEYHHSDGRDYITRVVESAFRSLSVEVFSIDRDIVKTVTFIKNSDGVLQEIRFSIKTTDIERSRSQLLEARYLIEGANLDIKPY